MVSTSADETKRHHQRVRDQHQSEIAQDYVEAVYRLKEEGKKTRVTDIQSIFGVSHVTVIRTLGRLEDAKLIVRNKQGEVELTTEGNSLAKQAYERHNLVYQFLIKLGVTPETASADTEGIEHHISQETVEKMRHFLEE